MISQGFCTFTHGTVYTDEPELNKSFKFGLESKHGPIMQTAALVDVQKSVLIS